MDFEEIIKEYSLLDGKTEKGWSWAKILEDIVFNISKIMELSDDDVIELKMKILEQMMIEENKQMDELLKLWEKIKKEANKKGWDIP